MTVHTEHLVEVITKLLTAVQVQIRTDVAANSKRYLEKITLATGKSALSVDRDAENSFDRGLEKKHQRVGHIKVYGEETMTDDLDLSHRDGLVALADIVDGTDLLEREMGNWCSAVTIFAPKNAPGSRIRAAFIALPPDGGKIYCARDDADGATVKLKGEEIKQVAGASQIRSLAHASICFYGQKHRNLMTTVGCLGVSTFGKDTRIYNLGGMPMIAKLIDHWIPNARGIDAVIEVCGQQPHDAIPALYIAKKAGCSVKMLDGQDMSFESMEEALLRPAASRISYVVAATPELCTELVSVLQTKP